MLIKDQMIRKKMEKISIEYASSDNYTIVMKNLENN